MNKAHFFISLLIVLIATNHLFAQEVQQNSTTINNRGLYVGGQVSTSGWGADVRYIFNKTITLKTGFETLKLNYEFDFNENEIEYDASLDYKTGGIFLMADFNFTRNLYVSVGASLNSLNPKIEGTAVSDFQYGDITIPASEVGDFIFTLTPSIDVSPYAGIGFRGFLGAKERVLVFVETGFYYLGAPNVEIEASGLLSPTADPAHGQKEVFENQFSQYKFYPVIKLNLAIKLF